MTNQIVTRFAPSPTGYLHVGGARTALFNWLYAQHCGGHMVLRIEDTDRSRSTNAAVDAIIEGLLWLGLNWDGEVVFQHARIDRHREVVDKLLATGNAYKCYATPQELADMREKARSESRTPRYDGRWRDRDSSDAPIGVAPAIRLRTIQKGETIVRDCVQGDITFANDQLDDLILIRSDGTPTYMLSVVVDDHDMDISHVIRGDDHLTNAARQSQIYQALGWDLPVWAHISLIHGSDGSKLSKRHGALGVEAYRAMGYLPQTMRNYLVRLGWSHGNDEIMTKEQMIRLFDLDAINSAPARFDLKKLENMNGYYLRNSDDETLIQILSTEIVHLEYGSRLDGKLDENILKKIRQAMPGLKERAKSLNELIALAAYIYVQRPISVDEKAEKLLSDESRVLLSKVYQNLEYVEPFTVEKIEEFVRTISKKENVKLGQLAQPLRAALTGTTISPGIFDVMEVLGRKECLERIGDQIEI
jgi:glutamyl-tRNA synthetase